MKPATSSERFINPIAQLVAQEYLRQISGTKQSPRLDEVSFRV